MCRDMIDMKPGDIVRVEFYDHCEDGDEPIKITAYGVLESQAQTHIVINSWVGCDDNPHNNKRFCIITSCISRMTKLHETAKAKR